MAFPSSPLAPLVSLDLHSEVLSRLHERQHIEVAGGGNPFSKAYFAASIFKKLKEKRLLWIADSKNEATELLTTLRFFFTDHVQLFALEQKGELLQRSIVQFLDIIAGNREAVALLVPEFLFIKLPRPELLKEELVLIKVGDTISPYHFFDKLVKAGYRQVDDRTLEAGEYRNIGDVLSIFPVGASAPIRISFFGESIEEIYSFAPETQKCLERFEQFVFFPMQFRDTSSILLDHIPQKMYVVADEVEMNEMSVTDPLIDAEKKLTGLKSRSHTISLTSFPETEDDFLHLRYLSLLKYYSVGDFLNDVKERYIRNWKMVLYTKHKKELKTLFVDNDILYVESWDDFFVKAKKEKGVVLLIEANPDEAIPRSFQNSEQMLCVLTDREIFTQKSKKKVHENHSAAFDFLASLKPGDFVVHLEHGIGRFTGIQKKEIGGLIREYLEIQYADNDKLFVPTDQADKISKFISNEDKPPRLTKLDSTEWQNLTKKVKKEAKKIAKELLVLYAKREMAKGFAFGVDTADQDKFERTFGYEETPGQIKAIHDVKRDMEKERPMDRLVCGDVGFGKTEVALRAAFKAVENKKQVAFIAPITILADQHYKSFTKRLEEFPLRVEMLSRFRTPAEQKKILKEVAAGEIDVLIGTHRLIQPDVKFKDLGLVIVDEEQRFGVKQKEKLKEFRCNVDVLTLTATPIPRTLHMSLNNLRDITTITTPPPGRLPIITEVRKFSDGLIRDAILREIKRGGQVYFLHNKVRTIEAIAAKLRMLVPEAKFLVAHGQMDPHVLEGRILSFKEKQFDVLVSSTIVENGIDLPNANTLIVNNADNFGLSQLYQLRGRVGRSRTQAFTYLLYSSRSLGIDAKKRLRAIVEASELGSGFQIAMKDLEIRGAGEILGSSQHGMMNSVGVSHFVRMLNQMLEELKANGGNSENEMEQEEQKDIAVELPLTSYIPDTFIHEYEEKISVYQKLSSLKDMDSLDAEMSQLKEEYGELPEEVQNLFKAITLKILARRAHVDAVRVFNQPHGLREINLIMGKQMKAENIFSLLNYQQKWFISGDRLKIRLDDLEKDWYNALKGSLLALDKVPEKLIKK